jgi:hypothetical protein
MSDFTTIPKTRQVWVPGDVTKLARANFVEAAEWDRIAYADRFHMVFSDIRHEDTSTLGDENTLGPWRSYATGQSERVWRLHRQFILKVPDPLPGSANSIEGADSIGDRTLANTGALVVVSRGLRAEVLWRCRRLELDPSNDGSAALAAGAENGFVFNYVQQDHSTGAYTALGDNLLLPPNTSPGELLEVQVLFRRIAGQAFGYVVGLAAYWPALTLVRESADS